MTTAESTYNTYADDRGAAVPPEDTSLFRARLEAEANHARMAHNAVRGTIATGYLAPAPDVAINHRFDFYDAARREWGTAHVKTGRDILVIGPIGSRSDYLLVWRTGGRVSTGCFEGTIDEFEARLEADYHQRLEDAAYDAAQVRRDLSDYRQAVRFLRNLTP